MMAASRARSVHMSAIFLLWSRREYGSSGRVGERRGGLLVPEALLREERECAGGGGFRVSAMLCHWSEKDL